MSSVPSEAAPEPCVGRLDSLNPEEAGVPAVSTRMDPVSSAIDAVPEIAVPKAYKPLAPAQSP